MPDMLLVVVAAKSLPSSTGEKAFQRLAEFAHLRAVHAKQSLKIIILISQCDLITRWSSRDAMKKAECQIEMQQKVQQLLSQISLPTNSSIRVKFTGTKPDQASFVLLKKEIEDTFTNEVSVEAKYSEIEEKVCVPLIFKCAGIAAGFGIIPGVDVAMSIVINDCLDLMLKAICGASGQHHDPKLTVILAIFRAALVAGNIAYVTAQLISKVLDATIIGLVVGQAISSASNFGITILNGFICWKMYSSQRRDLAFLRTDSDAPELHLLDDAPEHVREESEIPLQEEMKG